jgi:hypothetical protein
MKITIESCDLFELEHGVKWRGQVIGAIKTVVDDKTLDDTKKMEMIRNIFEGKYPS